jgi:hypothetical protein
MTKTLYKFVNQSFKLNATQIVSIVTIISTYYISSRVAAENSKILQTVLNGHKIVSLAGLIIFAL